MFRRKTMLEKMEIEKQVRRQAYDDLFQKLLFASNDDLPKFLHEHAINIIANRRADIGYIGALWLLYKLHQDGYNRNDKA